MAKSRGRLIALRWHEPDLIAIDDWRRKLPERISRPEAIRRLALRTLRMRTRDIGLNIFGTPLLIDIGEISIKNGKLDSCSAIAKKLISTKQEYKNIPLRTMRRHVTVAIDWQIERLKNVPPHLWQERFGIEPPLEMTKQVLRKKTLERLRYLTRLWLELEKERARPS
jgi:hypothetical protein